MRATPTGLRLPLVERADFKVGEAGGAEGVGQPLGIPDDHEGQVIRMDDRAVRLGGCFRRHRTQQRQAAVDVVVRQSGENLGRGLISHPIGGGVPQRRDTGEEGDGVVDLLAR